MFSTISDAVVGFFQAILTFLHDVFVPVFGDEAWGWSIIALTLVVRIFLLPLAIKQTRSMRAMQALQPKMRELQKKHKVDRQLMRKDPVQYKAKKQKLNEELMKLYQEEGANPAASCLPLLAQAPVFIALFWTIRGMDELRGASFYFFTDHVAADAADQGLAALVSTTGWPGWLLILLMSGTMFWSMRQMQARSAAQMVDNPMAQQQKILLYIMPVFLAAISFQFPLGLLLYWCTTNVWQIAQQAIILREVRHEAETGELQDKPGGRPGDGAAEAPRRRRGRKPTTPAPAPEQHTEPGRLSPGASSGKRSVDPPASAGNGPDADPEQPTTDADASEEPSPNGSGPQEPGTATSSGDHLPRRRRRRD